MAACRGFLCFKCFWRSRLKVGLNSAQKYLILEYLIILLEYVPTHHSTESTSISNMVQNLFKNLLSCHKVYLFVIGIFDRIVIFSLEGLVVQVTSKALPLDKMVQNLEDSIQDLWCRGLDLVGQGTICVSKFEWCFNQFLFKNIITDSKWVYLLTVFS